MSEYKKRPSVSVIIPVHNEAMNIGELLDQINSIKKSDWEIVVIDDGSNDDSASIARGKGACVVLHPYCIGNGAAIKSGLRKVKGDIVVMMDGDGQHSPEDIPRLLKEMDSYDMVVGARDWSSQSGFMRAVGNKIYNIFAGYVAKIKIPDLTSGFRAVKRKIAVRYIYMLPNTFSYPTTLTLSFMRAGHRVGFVPITTRARKGESKIHIIRDGVRFFLIISRIATVFSPFRVFLPISGILFLFGVAYYLYWLIVAHRFTNMALLLILLSVIIFLMGLISEQIAQLRYEKTEDTE